MLDATTDAPFEERLPACRTLEEAWWTIVGWHLPSTESEKELLTHQLENAQMAADEDPKLFFARIDGLINTLKLVGVTKEEREITRIIIRNLPDDYDVEKRGVLIYRRFHVSRWKKSCHPDMYRLVHGEHRKFCHQQMPSAIRTQ